MKRRVTKIAEILVRVVNKMNDNEKKPRIYGLRQPLYPSEIHMLMMIGQNPDAGVTGLAEKAGITKGAVSQTVKRLENKGLIKKQTDPADSKRIVLELTNKGRVAYYAHEQYHEETDRDLFKYLNSLSDKKLKVIEEFFLLLERGIDKRSET
jgi:DNA-binding MarR family transcriptional regulator